MIFRIQSDSVETTEAVGEVLGQWILPGMIVALDGDLGAGKTAFSRGIARGMGISEAVRSPTYTILIEHKGVDDGLDLFHFDTYRLDNEEDFIAAGLDEYFYQNQVCVIEWSDKIDQILPSQTIRVRIEGVGTEREISITVPTVLSEHMQRIETMLLPFLAK